MTKAATRLLMPATRHATSHGGSAGCRHITTNRPVAEGKLRGPQRGMKWILGLAWYCAHGTTFGEDWRVLDRRRLNYSAYPSSNSREPISSSSPFEYS